MDPRTAQTSKADVGLLLAKGKLVGCLTTGQSKRSTLDASDVNNFHNLLQLALNDTTRCTKECVAWIVCHVAKSRRRVAAFGDYLLKLSDSLLPLDTHSDLEKSALSRAQIAFGLLHLIDAIFLRIRENPGRLLRKPLETYLTFAKAIEPTVVQLVSTAAASRGVQALLLHQDLACLLHHWSQERLFTKRIRLELRNIARKAYIEWLDSTARAYPSHYQNLITKIYSKDVEDDIPNTHGLPRDAWFDLPVGTMIHAMKTTKPGHPVRTSQIKPLDMPTGSVDPDMMETVLDHIEECKDINAIPNISTTADEDDFVLNGLGLRLTKDPMSSEDRPKYKVVEGYYGFSVPFMKIFQNIEKNPSNGPERPQNWMPPPPPELAQPPAFHTGFPPNVPPPNRDAPHIAGPNYRQNDYGRGNNTGWRGDEMQGGRGGGNWRGRGRGWDRGNGYRPY
ncbi:unnamed protein product [Aureobasidium mustum]|uniref:CID domain-containing protein n=1 Tax=Aureobasidium mustum TaxID=2773714 RepID=A0A9N8KAV4_9PEZI|nr:unnamed protein product [Aureobasidium mustum]